MEVDGILNANNGLNVLGTITQGNLTLYEHNPTSATGRKGFIHPNRLDFAISSSATPSTSEAYAVMAGNQIYFKKETYVSDNLNVFGDFTLNGTVTGITPEMIGLGTCNNTSDESNPISTATQTALNTLSTTVNTISGRVIDNETLMYDNFNAINYSIYTNDYNTMNAISEISGAIASLAVGAFSGPTTMNSDLYVYGKIGQGTDTPESALHITGNRNKTTRYERSTYRIR